MKILKIGGSFITNKAGYKELNANNLDKMAIVISKLWKEGCRDFILVHGAGSFGHPLVNKYELKTSIRTENQRLGFADTHAACSHLSLEFVKKLIEYGVPAISIPPAVAIEQRNKRIISLNKIVYHYLGNGFLPILYGDMVLDNEITGSVCSGDQITAHLGKYAEFVVLATDVDGVLDSDKRIIPLITRLNFDEVSKHLYSKEGDVTGSMKGKIQEMLNLSSPAFIVNAAHPERIESILKGHPTISTKIQV